MSVQRHEDYCGYLVADFGEAERTLKMVGVLLLVDAPEGPPAADVQPQKPLNANLLIVVMKKIDRPDAIQPAE
jgi:predicted membrane GTPase involved in stress response